MKLLSPHLALCVLFLPASAVAERPITYEDALSLAIAANPALASYQYEVESAESSVTAARGQFDPNLTVTGSSFKYQDTNYDQEFGIQSTNDVDGWSASTSLSGDVFTGTNYSLSSSMSVITNSAYESDFFGAIENTDDLFSSGLNLSLNQNLLEGLKTSYNMQNITRAVGNLEATEVGLKSQRQQTLSDASNAYWMWLYQIELQQIKQDSVEVSEEALRVVQLRVESGELAPVELTRQKADLVQRSAELLEANNSAVNAADTLLLLLGSEPGESILPATEVREVNALTIDLADAVAVALEQNLELATQRIAVQNSEREVEWANHGVMPSLSANLTFGLGDQVDDFGAAIGGIAKDLSDPSWSVGGTYTMPLGNRSARGTRDQAIAAHQKGVVALHEAERSVKAAVASQVLALNSAQQKIELADANQMLAAETLAAEEALSAVGRAIQKDVLEERNQADLARVEAIRARIDYELARVELLRLQGQLLLN